MERNIEVAVRSLLIHSLEDVEFKYDGLTESEKLLVSREDFEALVKWLLGLGK